jgi:anthranilate phosphoribosyltransferase
MEWAEVAARLLEGAELSYEQAYWVMDQVMDGELGDVRLAAVLTGLAAKGASVTEIRGLADAMQDHAEPIEVPRDALDIVGTGGDRARTVNISTMSAIVLAGAGVPVVKHGNRASTSASGSADVIEALGINLELEPERVAEVFERVGITFLFANRFHPSMRYAAGTRRQLGFPTVFNILGPLTNPARPRAAAIGCAQERNAPLMAGVFAERGLSAVVFRGRDRGLDEITTVEPTQIWSVADGGVEETELDAAGLYGMARATVEDLRGGEARENAAVAREILDGRTGPVRDAVLLNTAAGLSAFGTVEGVRAGDGSLADRMRVGLDLAARSIDSGAAKDVLDRWIEESNR